MKSDDPAERAGASTWFPAASSHAAIQCCMRKIANLATPRGQICRVMIWATDAGASTFLYSRAEDGPCDFDEWDPTLEEAMEGARESFGIQPGDWTLIDDPHPNAPADWIHPPPSGALTRLASRRQRGCRQ